MKGFVFDENLPTKLTFVPHLPVTFASSLGRGISDTALWHHARENELVIVTKDADFSHRMMVYEPPPWVVHLRFGNMARKRHHEFLRAQRPNIEELLKTSKLVNVYEHAIEAIRS